jgi:phytoene dehydrogenase-like protein
MALRPAYDAIVIGSGPNGLSAAVTAARAKKSVLVVEANEQIGGGTRSAALTLPGFIHDVCSAVHPMAVVSPFFRSLPLQEHGLEWIQPGLPLAHPLDNGDAAILDASLEKTKQSLGPDSEAYERLIGTLTKHWDKLENDLFRPLGFPAHPLLMASFGLQALLPATRLAKSRFQTEKARALFAGLAAHAVRPLESWGTSAIGLVIGAQAHLGGWPIAKGGSQKIADALASHLRSLGGEIVTGTRVTAMKELPPSRIVLCDVPPRGLLKIAGETFPAGYRRALEKFEYGPGVFKIDWALSGAIPWKNSDCGKAGTIHLGGTLDEIAASERALCTDQLDEPPYVLVSQPTLFDPGRAPAGKHIAWAYCHVPANSTHDMTNAIEAQIERFAPGFKSRILARATKSPRQLEEDNANLVGGNITGGENSLRQLFLRPTRHTYETPVKGLFLCSASTPPGGGVHGLCGYNAAKRALALLDS